MHGNASPKAKVLVPDPLLYVHQPQITSIAAWGKNSLVSFAVLLLNKVLTLLDLALVLTDAQGDSGHHLVGACI